MPVPKGQSPNAIALSRRLAAGRLLPQDHERVAFAREIRERRATGATFAGIAQALKVPVGRVQEFATRGVYDVIVTHFEKAETGASGPVARLDGRGRLNRLVPRALDRLERSLAEGIAPDGTFLESKEADRAMQMVLDASGLLEPEHMATRPAIHIDTLVIQQLVQGIMADDAIIEARQRTAAELPPLRAAPD